MIMACTGCSSGTDSKAAGCKSNGGCSTGGCNRMNTYDWISILDIEDPALYPYVEASFKNGARKEFFRLDSYLEVITGDWVVVETSGGQDVGKVTLSGELVRLQMKKKNTTEDRVLFKVVRVATDRDLDHMHQARDMEKMALVKGRAIARTLSLDMKLGDIEYQADLRKATFFYTADRRIDFRELVRLYAKEFHIKIEMRQIGARQETARLGGIGSCGRELCCSTWLSDFKTVVTSAARYQNLAINQAKLSGQCGRLKCCLNYELDVYMESLDRFPMEIETIVSKIGRANLLKTDIFRGIMFYEIESNNKSSRESHIFGLSPESVRALKDKNDRGEIPSDFGETISLASTSAQAAQQEEDAGFADVTGEIELPEEKKRNNRNNRNRNKNPNQQERPSRPNTPPPSQRSRPDQSPRPERGNQGPLNRPNQDQRDRTKNPQNSRPENQLDKGPSNRNDQRPDSRRNQSPENSRGQRPNNPSNQRSDNRRDQKPNQKHKPQNPNHTENPPSTE